MILNIDLLPWVAERTWLMEVWVDDTRVTSFNQSGTYKSVEFIQAGNQLPKAYTHPPKKYTLFYNSLPILTSDVKLKRVFLRLYLWLPVGRTAEDDAWHHVADAYLEPTYRVNLFASSDNFWIKPPGIYGTVWLDDASIQLGTYDTILETKYNVRKEKLELIFNESILPDLQWISKRKDIHHSLDGVLITPPYQAIPNLPIYNDEKDEQFKYTNGASAQSLYLFARGGGQRPAEDAWIEARIIESLNCRGMHDPNAFKVEFPYVSRPNDRKDEFEIIMSHALTQDLIAKKHNPLIMHTWIRECLEDVIRGLGSHALTRRYMMDHVWQWKDGKLDYVGLSDNNTLSFQIPGDCEDSNSTIYYLALHIIAKKTYEPWSFLFFVRAAILLAGVPCCITGTSEAALINNETERYGSHAYGAFIPFPQFIDALLGNHHQEYAKRALDASIFGPGSAQKIPMSLFDRLIPMTIETIMFTSPTYLPRNDSVDTSSIVIDHMINNFQRCWDHFHEIGDSVTYPNVLAPEFPLGYHTVNTDHYVGCMLHDRMGRVLTDAIQFCFPDLYGQPILARGLDDDTLTRDCVLDRSMCMFLTMFSSDNHHQPKEGPLNSIGIRFESLFRNEPFRLVALPLASTTQMCHEVYNHDLALLKYERPFIPLQGSFMFRRPWDWKRALKKLNPKEDLPTFAKNRFTVLLYSDKLDEAPDRIAQLYQTLKATAVTVRPLAFGYAVILHTP
jgi:hypothetical protein